MGQTFQSLLDEFYEVKSRRYSNEPERVDALLESLENTMQAILEKLRDLHG